MATILVYGDTIRYPALRHEVPLEIVDPFLFAARDGRALVLTSSLEAERISKAIPGAEVLVIEELGFYELMEGGMAPDEAELETAVRAVERWGIREALVPRDLPVAVADRLREAGVRIEVDARAVEGRRRVKSAGELAGIRRARSAQPPARRRRRTSWWCPRCRTAGTIPAPGRCPPACRSSSTSGRATRRAAAGRT